MSGEVAMARFRIAVVWMLFCLSGYGLDVRPVQDRIGYAWDSDLMDQLIQYLEEMPEAIPACAGLVAGISPHDDYLYAGRVYLPLFRSVRATEVIIFGVTHRTVRTRIGDPKDCVIFETFDAWYGPYGDIPVSGLRDRLMRQLPPEMVLVSNEAHRLEHSIEGMLPFLQHYNRNVSITPVMVTAMSPEQVSVIADRIAGIVRPYCEENDLRLGRDLFILISADANHYGEDFDNTVFGSGMKGHAAAVANDRMIMEKVLSGPLSKTGIRQAMAAMEPDRALWCGHYSIPMGLEVLRILSGGKAEGIPLCYSDTCTAGPIGFRDPRLGTTAPFSLTHWVGHAAVGYRINKKTVRGAE
jgi:AmmeMemoRadiSam system protein B